MSTYTPADPATPGAWGWHKYSEALPDRPMPSAGGLWFPAIHTHDPQRGLAVGCVTTTRWEAEDTIRAALRRGRSVEVWDRGPSGMSQLVFAAGPASPLSCAWRPLRGKAPRYR